MTAVVTLLTQIHGMVLGPAGQALVLLTDGARSAAPLPLLLMGLSLWVSNKTERGTPRKGRWGEEKKIYMVAGNFKAEKIPPCCCCFNFPQLLVTRNSWGWEAVGPALAGEPSPAGVADWRASSAPSHLETRCSRGSLGAGGGLAEHRWKHSSASRNNI